MAKLTAITIQNFKAIGDPVRIELKPITMLFGPNNAGKSTVIDALLYAREMFTNRNYDPYRITVRGEQLDLGGFQSLVHNHDLSSTVTLALDIEVERHDIRWYEDNDEIRDRLNEAETSCLQFLDEVRQLSVAVSIYWSDKVRRALVKSFRVSVNGEFFCEIAEDRPFAQRLHSIREGIAIGALSRNSPLLEAFDHSILNLQNPLASWINLQHPMFVTQESSVPYNALARAAESLFKDCADWNWNGKHSSERPDGLVMGQSEDALPNSSTFGRIAGDLRSKEELPELFWDDIGALEELFKSLILGPCDIAAKCLSGVRYLGPLRAVPPRSLERSKSAGGLGMPPGSSTWDDLFEADESKLQQINRWMSDADRFELGYRVAVKRYHELESSVISKLKSEIGLESEHILTQISGGPEKTRLSLHQTTSGMELSFQDVGTGVSQVMPVITGAVLSKNQIMAVAQPELHLHPALQVKLADLFLSCIQDGNTFLLETHSEHLILRLLRRIRETAAGELPHGAPRAEPSQVSVVYLEREKGMVRACDLRIDNSGEFIGRWPRGFFEERAEELF